MCTHNRKRWWFRVVALGCAALCAVPATPSLSLAQEGGGPIVFNVAGANERIEMTVNSSRILTMDKNIPTAQVNNPDVLDLKAISAKQVQIYAKKTGITQVNLWDDKGNVHAVDVTVLGDVKQLSTLLKTQFPNASLRVVPTTNAVILDGFVDKAEAVQRIIEIAEDYYPKVINNIQVGGAHQVMLHVKVMEVSRTKLRELGFDFANISSNGSFAVSSISGLLQEVTATGVEVSGLETFTFGIVNPNNSFFGVLSALQRHNIAKLNAEPTLVTVSGRPAVFQSGGEIPVLIPQGLGNVSVEFRSFGTQLDFVPIVLGGGKIRLEVRPRVSEIDRSLSTTLNGSEIPGFRTRWVDTGVEMRVGQTLAIAGLIQTRIEATKAGVPWLCDIPVLGAPFRRVNEVSNEIELLVLVRPELAEALDPCEVPPCGPGDETRSPTDCELYWDAHLEVPNPECMDGRCAPGCGPHGRGGNQGMPTDMQGPQGGTVIEQVPAPRPTPMQQPANPAAGAGANQNRTARRPVVIHNPPQQTQPMQQAAPRQPLQQPGQQVAQQRPPVVTTPSAQPRQSAPAQYSPRYNPPVVQSRATEAPARGQNGEPGLIGPTGYDVIN